MALSAQITSRVFLIVSFLLLVIPQWVVGQVTLEGENFVFSQTQVFNSNTELNPEFNFAYYKQGQPAGNINGDNSDDFIVTSLARDDRTNSVLEDSVYKTAVFFGGSVDNISKTPDQVIYRKLIPVGDLNGDGFDDAIAANTELQISEPEEIYFGSSEGYSETGVPINSLNTASYHIIGFNDFNGDGFTDILSYSRIEKDIAITLGAENSEDISTIPYSNILTPDPKRVAVKDIDRDGREEIVEFSGVFGSGAIRIVKVDTDLSLNNLLTTTFTSFSGSADEKNRLFLVNTDGNEDSEILITTGKQNPTYKFEYNILDGIESLTSSLFSEWELIPAGDLDGDNITDFIRGDSSQAYITSNSFSSDIALDPQKYGGDWNMNYYPHRKFGDLNGDGNDDALLGFIKRSNNETFYGRNFLLGNTSDSNIGILHSHEYEEEKFYRQIEATEELGDINNDGVDDFAIVYSDMGKVEIFLGGNTIAETPSKTIITPYKVEGITSGDFSGGSTNDLLLLGQMEGESIIEVYEGGSALQKVQSISSLNFQQDSDISHLIGLNNIGDVNNDGRADFFVGSSQARDTSGTESYLQEGYIFFGGNINSTPDSTLDLDPSGDYTSEYIAAGESSAALGDIDGDGNNDFAVGSPNKFIGDRSGEVRVFLSSTGADSSLKPGNYPQMFGNDIASGDFNGDGQNDIAVTVGSSYGSPLPMVYIYYGGNDFDTYVDQLLPLPDFDSASEFISDNNGALEVIPDFNNDGKDELILTSAFQPVRYYYTPNNHAALFTFNNGEVIFIEAPNSKAGLGGQHKIATGDFDGNGELDMILSQNNDNNDAYQSSRVYRYPLPLPINITSAQDVPDDQGGQVRINIGGYLMDTNTNLDSLVVRRSVQNEGWVTVKSDAPSTAYNVSVPKTQPTGIDNVDYSYEFSLSAYKNGLIAGSQTVSAKAFDNIAPPPVQNVNITEENATKILDWESQGEQDVAEYLVYETNITGTKQGKIIGSSTDTRFSELGDHSGVQLFGIKARDVNNNLGEGSEPALALYNTTVNYRMTEGWNLIGIPVDATQEQIQKFIEHVSNGAIYEFDGVYKQVEELTPGKGYWMKYSAENIYEISALPATNITLELSEGWNLISGVGGALPLAKVQDTDNIIISETLYRFNQSYAASDTLQPGSGYWIRTSAPGTVTFVHPKLIADNDSKSKKFEEKPFTETEEFKKDFDELKITDGDHERTLYFGGKLADEKSKKKFALPPLAPGNLFDARFKDGSKLTEKEDMYVKLSRLPETSLELEVSVQALSDYDKFHVKEFGKGRLLTEYTIEANKGIPLRNSDTDAVYISPVGNGSLTDSEIPEKFILKQNYPNPFNPTTQISYSIPEAAEVTLEVFDLLGKKVATLVNEEKQPGTYHVKFNASNLASGIYLYRLRAGSYVSTRKLILAK